MPTQLQIDWNPIHKFENNPISQATLDAMREKFEGDCFEILKALMNRERLTNKAALLSGLSGHLARRICDLKQKFHIHVSKEWIYINERKSHVEYYMNAEDIMNASRILMEKMKIVN